MLHLECVQTCLKWFRTDLGSDPSIIKCSPAIQTENPGSTLLMSSWKYVNLAHFKFSNFNLLVLRAQWTDFDDFSCKMTAFASTFGKTKRKHFFRNLSLVFSKKLIFMVNYGRKRASWYFASKWDMADLMPMMARYTIRPERNSFLVHWSYFVQNFKTIGPEIRNKRPRKK